MDLLSGDGRERGAEDDGAGGAELRRRKMGDTRPYTKKFHRGILKGIRNISDTI